MSKRTDTCIEWLWQGVAVGEVEPATSDKCYSHRLEFLET